MINSLFILLSDLCGNDISFQSWVVNSLPVAGASPIIYLTFFHALMYLSVYVLVYQSLGIEINMSNLLNDIFTILNIDIVEYHPAFLNLNFLNQIPALICFIFLHNNNISDLPFIHPQSITGNIFDFSTLFLANLNNYYAAFTSVSNHTLIQNTLNTVLDSVLESIIEPVPLHEQLLSRVGLSYILYSIIGTISIFVLNNILAYLGFTMINPDIDITKLF
jgi:hypothetical protein